MKWTSWKRLKLQETAREGNAIFHVAWSLTSSAVISVGLQEYFVFDYLIISTIMSVLSKKYANIYHVYIGYINAWYFRRNYLFNCACIIVQFLKKFSFRTFMKNFYEYFYEFSRFSISFMNMCCYIKYFNNAVSLDYHD